MPASALSDVNFQSEVFKDTLQGEFTNQLALINAIMVEAPDQMISPDTKGQFVSIPKWKAISGSLVPITTGLTTTFNAEQDYKDIGVWLEREVAWSAEQIIPVIAGAQKDVTKEVARQFGRYLAEKLSGLAYTVAKGVFAVELASTHLKDDATAGNTININGLVSAKQKLGDNQGLLTAIAMHSKVEADALVAKILTYDKANVDSYSTGRVGSILGMTPQVSDLLTAVGDTYNSYLGIPGAMIYKFRRREKAMLNNANIVELGNGIDMEIYRDSITGGGIDGLIFRFSTLVHVPGVKWGVTTVNPTDAQLATGSNWTKVANDDKLIKLVCYQSK